MLLAPHLLETFSSVQLANLQDLHIRSLTQGVEAWIFELSWHMRQLCVDFSPVHWSIVLVLTGIVLIARVEGRHAARIRHSWAAPLASHDHRICGLISGVET